MTVRVAALYDIHANPFALRAVLDEVQREDVDLVVMGGDAVPGPLPKQTIAMLRALPDGTVFVCGNTDRWVVEAFDARPGTPPRPAADWTATVIDREERDFLHALAEPATIDVDGLGPTLFCHGSPRSDEEILTAVTPERRWRPMLEATSERVVVCGHTHAQSDRDLGGTRVVNAGSVGMPFEGRPGAYWALLGPGVERRRTDYDIRGCEQQLRAGGWPGVDDFLRGSFFEPAEPRTVAESLERQADAG